MFPELTADDYDERLKCARSDTEHEDYRIETVATRPDGHDVSFREGACLFVPHEIASKMRPPVAGDVLRLYGRGFGSVVRGIALVHSGIPIGLYRYRTTDECAADIKAERAEYEAERRRKWSDKKLDTIAKIQKLPDAFQKRFNFFLRNADWGWQFGLYEAGVLIEAWKIFSGVLAHGLRVRADSSPLPKLSDEIARIRDLPAVDVMKIVPDLDPGLSGNALGCAMALARAYALRTEGGEQHPELYQYHGAMCPLMGCKEYGCYSTTPAAHADASKKDRAQTEYTSEERDRMVREMKRAAVAFYNSACLIGHHPFVEMAGLMNETIKMWEAMHVNGIDFGTAELRAESYNLVYLAEKIDCIWGPALASQENRDVFLNALAEKGGWTR